MIALNSESSTLVRFSTAPTTILNVSPHRVARRKKNSKVKVKMVTVLKQVPKIKLKISNVKNIIYVPHVVFSKTKNVLVVGFNRTKIVYRVLNTCAVSSTLTNCNCDL